MKEEDLIRKLEEVSLPAIEIPSHQRNLRLALLNRYFKEKRNWEVFGFFKKAIPATLTMIILMSLVYNFLILPDRNLAKAREISLKNPQIKEWIEKGAIIKDIEIIKNKAYVLVQPTSKIGEVSVVLKPETPRTKEEFFGALAEIDLKNKKVSSIEKIDPVVVALTEKEQERIKEISTNDPEIQKTIPKEAEILKIETVLAPLRLMKKDSSVSVVSEPTEEKEVQVIYEYGQKQWESKIDLKKEEVKAVNFLGESKE